MPYTLNLSLFDVAGYYAAGLPTLAGTVVDLGGATLDTASSAPATLTLNFASAAVPPPNACAVLVLDTGTTGDLIRSGAVSVLPPSPGKATVITVPPALISGATVTAAAAGSAVPPTAVPAWIQVLSGVLTAGTYIPLMAALPAPSATLGSGTITVTATGTLTVRVLYFSVRTFAITVTATVAPAASNDPLVPSRVLRMPLTSTSLLSAAVALPGLGAFLASIIASTLEAAVNSTIASMARSTLTGMGLRLTPSAVICARRITVAAPSGGGTGGINLQLAISDLFGAAITAVPRTLAVTITPAPQVTVTHTYVVTVTDALTGSPVPMATVTLRNYSADGALTTTANTTDAAGHATFTVSLHFKRTYVIVITKDDGRPEREREEVLLPPTLTVDASGFNSVRLTLL